MRAFPALIFAVVLVGACLPSATPTPAATSPAPSVNDSPAGTEAPPSAEPTAPPASDDLLLEVPVTFSEAALGGARPLTQNGYKIDLTRALVSRAPTALVASMA